MHSHDERMAKRAAERAALEAKLDREQAEREAAAGNQAAAVVSRPEGGKLRAAAFLVGVVTLAVALFGSSVTLVRLAGRDFTDARRAGQAVVDDCTRQGPITNKGFGHWDRCSVTIRWDDGADDRLVTDAVFTSADIGKPVRVGDLGRHRQSRQLAREDTPRRSWLAWTGYGVGFVGLVPGFLALALIGGLLRRRGR